MNPFTIVFDVGGTAIKAAVTTAQGEVIESTVETYPAHSDQSKEFMLDHFYQLIRKQAAKISDPNQTFAGVGYAYPGPCDYERGISLIQGLQKFDALYGVSILDAMRERIDADQALRSQMIPNYRIIFDNDARLFGVGQLFIGPANKADRAICITIGTGTGSAFIDQGIALKNKEIYARPFRNSMIDDYISKRGVLRIAAELGLPASLDVKDIADAARDQHDEQAIAVFRKFGEMFGQVLLPFMDEFGPKLVIIGGQIAKASDLFLPYTRQAMQDRAPEFHTVMNSSHSTFAGISALIQGYSE
ncbi:ROK family protein [Paenibacillus terrigena]|uniref:ROK family protein n=1 Tax=Paenibacillus terrigena TaxID=369333 RepID=UPI00035D2489|nr:ROK family protein [Paenibacillus terrigena]